MTDYRHCNNLIIGLGGTGCRVVKELETNFANHSQGCNVQFLCIDSVKEDFSESYSHKYCNIYTDLKKTDDYNGILSTDFGQADSSAIWNNIRPLTERCHWMESWTEGCGAKQNRRAGRIMFGAHLLDIDRYFNACTSKLNEVSTLSIYQDLNIYIIVHLSGGTGSGSIVDMIMLIKSYFRDARIMVVGILPTVPPPLGHDIGRYLANAYATLTELNALNKGNFTPIDISIGIRHRKSFMDTHSKLFSLLLLNTGNFADILFHLITLPFNDQTRPFIEKLENEPVLTLGFSKLVHPHEALKRNFSYDGSEERHMWKKLFIEADCKLIAEDTDYIRLACIPYSSDERNSFAPTIKWMNDILRRSQEILIDNSIKDRDEISMMSLGFGFQLHSISIMPELRKQYEQLISANKMNAVSTLHIEDECEKLQPLLCGANDEGRKTPYILLAMAMEILFKDYNLYGEEAWIYKTEGILPDGTPYNGTFYNCLNWLDPKHNFIYDYEIPPHLYKFLKRDVDNLITSKIQDSLWTDNILYKLDSIASSLMQEFGFTKAAEEIIEAKRILTENAHYLNSNPTKLLGRIEKRFITYHFCCSIMLQCINQLQYNYYKEGLGYVYEPRIIDWKDKVHNASLLEYLMISHRQLSLDQPLREEMHDYPFEMFWDYIANMCLEEAMTNRDNPISFINDTMHNAFYLSFRDVGVYEYFHKKTQCLNEISANHIRRIEQFLDEKYDIGEYGTYDIIKLTGFLTNYFMEMRDDNIKRDLSKEIEYLNKIIKDMAEAYYNSNQLIRIIRREQLLRDYCNIVRDFYLLKTRYAALEFEEKLISRLIYCIDEISHNWEVFANYLEQGQSDIKKKMIRLKELMSNKTDLKNWNSIENYELKFNRDKENLEIASFKLRNHITILLDNKGIKDLPKYTDNNFFENEKNIFMFEDTVDTYIMQTNFINE